MNEWLADPRVTWFIFGFILLVSEIVTPGVVLMFFGFGAWATVLFLFIMPLTLPLQLVVFTTASVGSLVLFRAKIRALFYNKSLQLRNLPSNLSYDCIGTEVSVMESIIPPHPGRVLLNGTLWQATANQEIPAGNRVRITSQDVLMLTVELVA